MAPKSKTERFRHCYQCVAGPDLMWVRSKTASRHVSNPTTTYRQSSRRREGSSRPRPDPEDYNQTGYNLKRTNPKKGRTRILVSSLFPGRKRLMPSPQDARYPQPWSDRRKRISAAGSVVWGRYADPVYGLVPRVSVGVGPDRHGFRRRSGRKGYHSEHLYGELWHRAFIVARYPYCNYVNCGNNVEVRAGWPASGQADARVRGLKGYRWNSPCRSPVRCRRNDTDQTENRCRVSVHADPPDIIERDWRKPATSNSSRKTQHRLILSARTVFSCATGRPKAPYRRFVGRYD